MPSHACMYADIVWCACSRSSEKQLCSVAQQPSVLCCLTLAHSLSRLPTHPSLTKNTNTEALLGQHLYESFLIEQHKKVRAGEGKKAENEGTAG